jgi:hypothetical protein
MVRVLEFIKIKGCVLHFHCKSEKTSLHTVIENINKTIYVEVFCQDCNKNLYNPNNKKTNNQSENVKKDLNICISPKMIKK